MADALSPFLPILHGGHWFAGLSEPFRRHILDHGELATLRAGAMLFARGDPPNGLYALLDGAIEIGAVDADGNAAVLTVADVSTWFGEIAVFDGLSRTHDATALAPVTVLRVPHGSLLAFLDRHPACWRELALLLTEKLRLSFAVVEAAALLPASQRLAARLLMIAEGYGGASRPQRDIALSQERLAAMLALSRQTTNQLLKRLEGDGLIEVRPGHIVVIDLDGLRRASGRT